MIHYVGLAENHSDYKEKRATQVVSLVQTDSETCVSWKFFDALRLALNSVHHPILRHVPVHTAGEEVETYEYK